MGEPAGAIPERRSAASRIPAPSGRRKALLFFAILALAAGCDHAAKRVAQATLASSPPLSLAADTLRFELAFNTGAFLSLGEELPEWLRTAALLFAVPLVLVGACAFALRSDSLSRRALVGAALFAGGGFANWLDRALHDGAVTDFVSIGVGPLRTGIFNVADVAVLLGAALMVLPERAGPPPPPSETP